MDFFKRLRIAVLSTALLFVTNTLAAATQKANLNPPSQQFLEAQIEPEKTLGLRGQENILAKLWHEPAVEVVAPAYP